MSWIVRYHIPNYGGGEVRMARAAFRAPTEDAAHGHARGIEAAGGRVLEIVEADEPARDNERGEP